MNKILYIIQFDSFIKTLIPTMKLLIQKEYKCNVHGLELESFDLDKKKLFDFKVYNEDLFQKKIVNKNFHKCIIISICKMKIIIYHKFYLFRKFFLIPNII